MIKEYLLYFFVFLILSCNKNISDTEKIENILSTYNHTLSSSHHIYVIKSKFSCKGCIQQMYIDLNEIIPDPVPDYITIISYNKKELPLSLVRKVEFLHDTNYLVDKYYSHLANITILETDNKEIVRTYALNIENSREFFEIISDFISEIQSEK